MTLEELQELKQDLVALIEDTGSDNDLDPETRLGFLSDINQVVIDQARPLMAVEASRIGSLFGIPGAHRL